MSKKEFVHSLSTDDLVLLIDKRSAQLLAKLNDTVFGFEQYLKTRKYVSVNGEICLKDIEIVLEILRNACSEKKHLSLLRKFLRMLKDCDKFLYYDVPSVISMCLPQKQDINIVKFIANYICILKSILRQFTVAKIVDTFPTLQNFINRLKELKIRNIEVALYEFQGLKTLVDKYDEPICISDDEEDRVENFRKLSVVPRDNDIVNCEIVNLPINIIDAPYKSVTHYLSVHYRLMREDMLRTFRDCIGLCVNSGQDSVFKTGCNLYQGVNVIYPPEYTVKGIQYNLQVFTTKKIDWGKNLLPGSLVCLTADSFHSVTFASVIKVKASEGKSENCMLTVLLEDDLMLDKLNPKDSYLMIETSAYFECYRHVLSAIKEFTENSFPLADVIVYLDYEDTEPEYLSNMQYCLHEKCPGDVADHDSHSCKIFDPHDKSAWPTAEELELDDQQCEALRIALTKKVAIIQGPPGTGKTYMGVKIVKYLLSNVHRSPIIISCLTNHALDQFLERILLHTNKVVRLGSQSKSKVLEPYVMDNMIMAIKMCLRNTTFSKKLPQSVLDRSACIIRSFAPALLKKQIIGEFNFKLRELEAICEEVNDSLTLLDLCQHKYLDDSALNKIISSVYKQELISGSGTHSKQLSTNICEWLAIKSFGNRYEECEKYFRKISSSRSNLKKSIYENPNALWSLNLNTRYMLFYNWREDCMALCKENIKRSTDYYQVKFHECQGQTLDGTKLELLKTVDVIGVTTTGASKYKELLRFAEPTIMIIEEAAEVLESHIIASLVPSIQHLVLIGDHKQLRPIPAIHELSEKYNLKISMFERLILNSAPSATLVTQHRMKPCIAELLVPDIYDELRHAENVYQYEEIRGMKCSVFFLDHSEPENINSSSVSASNEYEARVIVSVAQYLCALSYPTDQIAILATYAAQVVLIQQYLNKVNLDIYSTTVDNYQGEENDIILISFVRSNSGIIGYLKENNRVCVALSRAKKGMFCIGNFKLFSRKSELWNSIVTKLKVKNMIGEKLPMQCDQHKTVTQVKTADDIVAFLKSGCGEKCNFELPCGHKCNRSCHLDDRDHFIYFCQMPCTKFIDESRICPRLCYQPCKRVKKCAVELPCGHYSRNIDSLRCEEEVQRCLPCSHVDTLPCYLDVSEHKCQKLVSVDLSCGHVKDVPCFNRNNIAHFVCNELQPKISPCGHIVYVPCSLNVVEDELLSFCTKSCDTLLNCGHPCVGFCRWCFDFGIHAFCIEKCELKLPCGHNCEGYCGSPCPPCEKKCYLSCPHGIFCINKCTRPCIECKENCMRRCEHIKCTNKCFEECTVDPCVVACREILPCSHKCIGLCGDPCICQECNDFEFVVGNNYVLLEDCDHIIEVNRLNEHIETCLSSFDWPSCPLCSVPLSKSRRYKTELLKAKQFVLKNCDTTAELSDVYYYFNSMFGTCCSIPFTFFDVHRKISEILERDHPSSASLLILKNCIICLRGLLLVSQKLDDLLDEYLVNRFETLLLWTCNHLTNASFQQLCELEEAVKALKMIVCPKRGNCM